MTIITWAHVYLAIQSLLIGYLVLSLFFDVWFYFKTRNLDALFLLWRNDNQLTPDGLDGWELRLWRLTQGARWAGATLVAMVLIRKTIEIILGGR